MIAICQVCAKKYTIPDGETPDKYKCECGGNLLLDVLPSKVFYAPGNNKNSTLISCPDCGRTVSRNAAYCPSCGGLIDGFKIPLWNMIQITLVSMVSSLFIASIGFIIFMILFAIYNALT